MEILEFSWLPALAGGIMIGTASAVLFGIGWGIGGFCPDPTVASIFTGKNRMFCSLQAV